MLSDKAVQCVEWILLVIMVTAMYLCGWVLCWPGFENHWLDRHLTPYIEKTIEVDQPYLRQRKGNDIYWIKNPNYKLK